jgi:hypothetical protein
MPKAIRIVAIALILLLGAALCVFAVAESSTYHECVSSAEQEISSRLENGVPTQFFTTPVAFRCVGDFVKRNNAAVTAISTTIIAIFTTIFGLFTISLAKSTRVAADAAILSARAAIAIELPVIRADAQKLDYGYVQDETGRRQQVSINELSISNLGKTKAFPIEVQVGCTIGRRLPKTPIYRFTKSFPVNAILEPDQRGVEVSLSEFEFEAPPDIYNMLRARSINLWFYCNLVYFDFMQARHQAGFCWKRHETTGTGAFFEDPTPAYNRKT